MNSEKSFISFFKTNWLCLLIAAQPVLDVIAYWNQNSVATVAGYIRLLIMLVLPLHLLFSLKKKGGFVLSMGAIGLYCALHALNALRLGYLSPFFDLAYLAKIVQMPVLAICFVFYIRDEKMKKQALDGILWAGGLTLLFLAIAWVTGTWTSTYDNGIGLSGWVIDDNRCANSILFVTMAVFAMLLAWKTEKKWLRFTLPALICLVLILNGTKACYLGLFAILAGFAAFAFVSRFVTGERMKKLFILWLVLLIAASAAVYPISPRAKVDSAQSAAAIKSQGELDQKLRELGYDISSMSLEEKLSDPVLVELFGDYYNRLIGYVIPHMFQRFGTEKVLIKYDMTTSAARLIDVRLMKTTYASLIWDECDGLTKLVGFEPTAVCKDGSYDMENDYHALFYYTGYLGFGMYCLFILYFVLLVIRRLVRDFKGSFTGENFALLLCLLLQLGLAQFSGAILRRPNVSIYMSLILALIYYKTLILPESGRSGREVEP